ncbi:MAG: Barrel-sandwich domain of CusB or HlyD rane-fusion [Friedmanniella sp.]|nr:Barrel-sandwich domain of CusB or HlyD rane-fusion [Friedmanniella sp.]
MTWIARLRLFAGILGVVALVAVLTLIFNQRQTKVASLSATVAADTYDVGAAYGGTVSKQFVKEGDTVKKGQKLFTIESVTLKQDLDNNISVASTDAYTVDTSNATITYKATVAGQVGDLSARTGNALGNGQPLATITVAKSQYIDARYLLSPRDYERVQKGATAKILLPNNETITGTVTTIQVATENAKAATKVRVDSPQLTDPALADLTKDGTPVVATLQLRDDGPLAGPSDLVFNFLRQIGLQ